MARTMNPGLFLRHRAALLPSAVGLAVALLSAAGCDSRVEQDPDPSLGTTSQSLSTASCVEVPETGDSTLANPPMRENFGSDRALRVGAGREALLQFDFTTLPPGAAIDRATLALTAAGGDDRDDDDDDACERDGEGHHRCPTINLHRVTAPWSESSVTFASFGQHFVPAVVGSLSLTSRHSAKAIDLTALVTAWASGTTPNYGVLLETRSRQGSIFVSREGLRPEQRPRLQVCYSVPINHCAASPCQNGAACTNSSTGYTCACAPGYTGTNCESQIDNCASNPCQNAGACANGVNTYTCACAPGFAGRNCETNIDDCAGNPCQNGGVCQDGVASYQCHCAPGYTGASCETLVNNCASTPCQNGGSCSSGVNSYTCACAAGFGGVNCEINVDDCVGNSCQNGATCVDGLNAYTCACPPDWGGARCELNLNDCGQNPCLNGATCQNGLGSYTCTCAPGYAGTNCQTDINDCANNPCQNGGVCVDGVNAHTCQCASGFTGVNCEVPPVAQNPQCPVPSAGGGATATYRTPVNEPVRFDASGSFDPNGDPMTYEWDLHGWSPGDNFTKDAVGPVASFTYALPGTYTIVVMATDHPELNVVPYAAPDCRMLAYATVMVGVAP